MISLDRTLEFENPLDEPISNLQANLGRDLQAECRQQASHSSVYHLKMPFQFRPSVINAEVYNRAGLHLALYRLLVKLKQFLQENELFRLFFPGKTESA